jgi:hypothetical protein
MAGQVRPHGASEEANQATIHWEETRSAPRFDSPPRQDDRRGTPSARHLQDANERPTPDLAEMQGRQSELRNEALGG